MHYLLEMTMILLEYDSSCSAHKRLGLKLKPPMETTTDKESPIKLFPWEIEWWINLNEISTNLGLFYD